MEVNMAPEKIILEFDPDAVKVNPLSVVPPQFAQQSPTDTYISTAPAFITYSSQDTEQSLRPFKIDRIQLEEDGTTNVYYSVFHSSVPTELENRTANAVGSINMPVYDKTEAEKLIFETVVNKGWYS
jgi:hypothetical protein